MQNTICNMMYRYNEVINMVNIVKQMKTIYNFLWADVYACGKTTYYNLTSFHASVE